MCENQQNVQVNIIQNNRCNHDSEEHSAGAGLWGLAGLVLAGAGIVWLVMVVLASAFRALGQAFRQFSDGWESIAWIEVIGVMLCGIVIIPVCLLLGIYLLTKGAVWLSAVADRRKEPVREIMDAEVIEEAPEPKALPAHGPVYLNLEPQNAYHHGNH